MSSFSAFITKNTLLRRAGLVLFSSLAILSSAASCSLPGIPGLNSGTTTTLGVLKRDPSLKKDGFGRVNNTVLITGETDSQGLASLSGLKLIQQDQNNLFLLTKQKGLFKTTDAGKSWKRQFVFDASTNATTDAQKKADQQATITKNDAFVTSDVAQDQTNPNVIYVSGKYNGVGKIYVTKDGGSTFKEAYTEVQDKVGVLFITIDPSNNNRIFAVLEGGALIRSEDGGTTWQKIRSFQDAPIQMAFVPEFDNTFFILFKTQGLFISKDHGQNWETQTLTKSASSIGETQPKDKLDVSLQNTSNLFGSYEKVIPVTAQTGSWIILADRQMWYAQTLATPFTKLVLPLQAEQYNLLDVAPDPKLGLDKLLVSVDSKLFDTSNRGQTWSTADKIQISATIGNIGQILIDKTNSEVIYLMLVDPKAQRGSSLFGAF